MSDQLQVVWGLNYSRVSMIDEEDQITPIFSERFFVREH